MRTAAHLGMKEGALRPARLYAYAHRKRQTGDNTTKRMHATNQTTEAETEKTFMKDHDN